MQGDRPSEVKRQASTEKAELWSQTLIHAFVLFSSCSNPYFFFVNQAGPTEDWFLGVEQI